MGPSNILLDGENHGHLSGFDRLQAPGAHTMGGLGGPHHWPPEMYETTEIDARADVYGAGMVTLFVLLGRPPAPFVALTQPEIFDSLPVSAALREAIRAAVAVSRDDRPASCEPLLAAIRAFLHNRELPVNTEPLPRESGERERLYRFILAPSTGVKLALARYENANFARATWEQLERSAGAAGRTVAIVDFAGEPIDRLSIVDRLQQANEVAGVLFAVGLDGLLLELGVRAQESSPIARLNFERDLLPDRLRGVVIFWLSYRAARAFATLAPDTFDVFVTTFEFPEFKPRMRPELTPLDLWVRQWPEWLSPPSAESAQKTAQRVRELEFSWARSSGDGLAAADLASTIGRFDATIARPRGALMWLERAASGREQGGDFLGAARDRRRRAGLLGLLGELEAADTELDAALSLAERAGSLAESRQVLGHKAELTYLRGDTDQALVELRALLSPDLEPAFRARLLSRVADVLRLRGEFSEAVEVLRDQVIPAYQQLDMRQPLARAWQAVGLSLSALGQPDEALRVLHDHALVEVDALDDRLVAVIKWDIADILYVLGEYEQCLAILRDDVRPIYERLAIEADRVRVEASIAVVEEVLTEIRRAHSIAQTSSVSNAAS